MRAQVSPHHVRIADLRAARSAGGRRRGRVGGALAPARAQSSRARGRPRRHWVCRCCRRRANGCGRSMPCACRRASDEAAVRRRLLERFNIEDGRRSGPAGRQDLAHRADGQQLDRSGSWRSVWPAPGRQSPWYVSCTTRRRRAAPALCHVTAMTQRLLVVVAAAALAACATNPVTGKRELSLLSEAQEIAIGRRPTPRCGARWASTTTRRCSATCPTSGTRLAAAVPPPEPAVDVRGRGSSGGQRLRPARRIHLHHARHPAVSRRRGGAGRGAGPRDWRTSPRDTRRSNTRGRRAARSGSSRSASSCPPRGRSAISRRPP